MGKQTVFVALLFFTMGFLIFYPALSVGFVSDDYTWLEKSRNLAEYDPFNPNSYVFEKSRPGSMLVFALLYKLFSLNSAAFHLIILVFHIFNTFILFLIFRDLKMDFRLSFLSSIIFLVHFSHEESLFWVASLSVIFCLFFSLLTVWSQLKWSTNGGPIFRISSVIFFMLALSIREDAIIIPFLLLSLAYFAGPGLRKTTFSLKHILKQNIPYLLPTAIYVAYRLGSSFSNELGYPQLTLNSAIWAKNFLYFVLNALVPLRYLFDLTGYEKHEVLLNKVSIWSRSALVMIAGSIAFVLFVLGAIKARKRIPESYKVGIFLFLVALLPYLILNGNGQRFLYFSLAGASIVLATFLLQVSRVLSDRFYRSIAILFMLVFCAFNFWVIQERSRWWIKAGLIAEDIVEQTKRLSGSLGFEDSVFVVNLPRRLNGAYIFHAGYREAIPLIIPDKEKKIQDLGFKDSVELNAFRGFKVYTYENGAMKEIEKF